MITTLIALHLGNPPKSPLFARQIGSTLVISRVDNRERREYEIPKFSDRVHLVDVIHDRESRQCAALFGDGKRQWFIQWRKYGLPPTVTQTGYEVSAILSGKGRGWVYDVGALSAIRPGSSTRLSYDVEDPFANDSFSFRVCIKRDAFTGSKYASVRGSIRESMSWNSVTQFVGPQFSEREQWGETEEQKVGSKMSDFWVDRGRISVVTRDGQVIARTGSGDWRNEGTVSPGVEFGWVGPNTIVRLSREGALTMHSRAPNTRHFTTIDLPEEIFDRYRVCWLSLWPGNPVIVEGLAGETMVYGFLDTAGRIFGLQRLGSPDSLCRVNDE